MFRKASIAVIVCGCIAIAACNTVRGAAADLNSAANCTENTIKTGNC